ncbi:MBL fold metallo-hydrolase [Corynebacterium poyangense]|uniref:MBL fold metallo-hydrolase n=1 Tax=Corynebacterium poyangense TaxID=2684405 RepID=A0A7H0SP44_9CORY|nr:MBL fold metallo-hydrolase [Corynebacterium poyangense]MBZ8177887.1 MBL fold metallo-hydrolase [Corynebacterium poyangense]QNQ90319.1 MBL fold metallo-hydrolase [Corynebacterium poyangense]
MEILTFATGPYATNCYVIINDDIKTAVVIDPGIHARPKIDALLADKELTLESILLTHGHIDHTRDAEALSSSHGVPVYLHPADHIMLTDLQGGVSQQAAILFNTSAMKPVKDLRGMGDNDEINAAGLTLTVVHAPGHSPGCVMFRGEDVCFSGDVLFRGSIGRTDLPGSDHQMMLKSLKEKVLPLADKLAILPGHGPGTTMRHERKTNPYLQLSGR